MRTSNREYGVAVACFLAGVALVAFGQPIGALLLVYPGWLFLVSAIAEGTRRGMATAREDAFIEEYASDDGPTRA